tara:strand:- start:2230 stop:2712 length:483 start_codon:yes stop_codon:yes gene_type:complete
MFEYEGGYNYEQGMSNRAVRAYRNGLQPLSRMMAVDFVQYGITIAFAKWLAKEGYWKYAEWHHTGNHYNKTYFYDADDLEVVFDDHDKDELLKLFKEGKPKMVDTKNCRVRGTYITFYKSCRRYIPEENDFSGNLKGNWIFLDGGGKKKADGRNITWEYV